MPLADNGNWRSWVLGVVATLFSAMVISAIVFRSDTKELLREHSILIKNIELRLDRLEHR